MRAARCSVACVLVASIFSACSSGASDSSGGPEPTAPTSSSTPAPTPAADGTPSGGRDVDVDELVVPAAAAAMPATWQERLVIRYGRGRALLGTSPGGDSGSLVTTLDDVAVGLLFAGSSVAMIANQIENVRALLRVEVAEEIL